MATDQDEATVGRRRLVRTTGPTQDTVNGLGAFEPQDLSDVMLQSHTLDPEIAPLYPDMTPFAGPAVTVTVPAGSQAVQVAAIDLAGPGDVLVMCVAGRSSFAVLGGRLAAKLRAQGVMGVVIDGNARDREEIQQTGLPVLCRGLAVAAGPKTGPGEINVAVACGGVVIRPGDVVVGGMGGAVSVPLECADAVLETARSETFGIVTA